MENTKTTQTVSWIALLLSILAIILAWAAYNRAGQDLEQQVGNQAEIIREEVRQQIAIAEARARLLVIQARLATGLTTSQASQEITQIRNELRKDLENTQGEIQQQWRQIDTSLGQLETQFRNNSADALNNLQRVIDQMEQEIRTDENQTNQTR